MKSKEIILKQKQDYYGQTPASIDFAMSEYAELYGTEFALFIFKELDLNIDKFDLEKLKNKFKIKHNL